jgi:hypothetical protein
MTSLPSRSDESGSTLMRVTMTVTATCDANEADAVMRDMEQEARCTYAHVERVEFAKEADRG